VPSKPRHYFYTSGGVGHQPPHLWNGERGPRGGEIRKGDAPSNPFLHNVFVTAAAAAAAAAAAGCNQVRCNSVRGVAA
jgi:hypothetical protein